jgi:hypothetical protein
MQTAVYQKSKNPEGERQTEDFMKTDVHFHCSLLWSPHGAPVVTPSFLMLCILVYTICAGMLQE